MINSTILRIPRVSAKTQEFANNAFLVLCGSILVAILAQIRIPLLYSPVPITGQTLGVILVGGLLGSKRGAMSMIVYLMEGMAGLPVFAGGMSGLVYMMGPTGGYLIGFVAAAYVCGLLAEKSWTRNILLSVAAMTIATFVIFAFGTLWLSMVTGADNVLAVGLIPFLPGAVIKILIAGIFFPVGYKTLKREQP